MDNNLINIDDLVKQRLSGGEERERPGSWSRMQELLEQEEKKKPIGMIFWRRGLGAVGVLLLLTMLTVGRDEVITVFKGLGSAMTTNNNNVGTAVANNHEVAAISQPNSPDAAAAAVNAPVAATDKAQANGTVAANNVAADKSEASVAQPVKPVAATVSTAHSSGNSHKLHEVAGTPAIAAKNGVVKNTTTAADADANELRVNEIKNKAGVDKNVAAPIPVAGKNVAGKNEQNGTSLVKGTSKPNVASNNTNAIGKKDAEIAASVATNNTPKHTSGNSNNAAGKKQHNTASNNINTIGNTDAAIAEAAATNNTPKHTTGKANSTAGKKQHKTSAAHTNADNNLATTDARGIASKQGASKTTGHAKSVDEEVEISATTSTKANRVTPENAKQQHNKGIAKATPSADKRTATDISKMPLSAGVTGIAATGKKNSTPSLAPVKSINPATVAGKAAVNTTPVDIAAAPSASKQSLAVNAPVNQTNVGKTTPTTNAPLAGVTPKKTHDVVVSTKQVRTIEAKEKTEGQYPGKLTAHYDTILNEKKTIVEKKTVNDEEELVVNAEMPATPDAEKSAQKTRTKTKGTVATAQKSKPGTSSKTAAKGGNSATSVATGPTVATTTKTGNATGVATSGSVASRVFKMTPISRILPAAAPRAMAAPANVKAATPKLAALNPAETEGNGLIADKKKGLYFLQSLSAAFNDVKYKFGNAKFSAGLTAGINGTFFGPSSCKGFHFGATANFELDEKWNFLAELKYIHRVNSTYFMHVTYDNYIPDPQNGGYTKDPTEVDYTFSTLHSFEMPLSLRYNAGKLDFFGGANFLYTLGVNVTGSPIRVQGAQVSHVSAVGPNNTPSIQVSDFDRGRFGVGYLFGVDYRIAPNMMLDFRNVQTVWDNSQGSSSKVVSNNLFKSPSLQFSLFYTFGQKNDDK